MPSPSTGSGGCSTAGRRSGRDDWRLRGAAEDVPAPWSLGPRPGGRPAPPTARVRRPGHQRHDLPELPRRAGATVALPAVATYLNRRGVIGTRIEVVGRSTRVTGDGHSSAGRARAQESASGPRRLAVLPPLTAAPQRGWQSAEDVYRPSAPGAGRDARRGECVRALPQPDAGPPQCGKPVPGPARAPHRANTSSTSPGVFPNHYTQAVP